MMMRFLHIAFVAAVVIACKRDEPKPAPPAAATGSATQHAALPSTSASSPPAFAKWKSSDVVALLKHFRVGVEGVRPMTKDDYGVAPMLADEGTYFLIPTLGPDKGGRIMSFSNADDLAKMKAYYDDLKKSSAAFFSWTVAHENILIQLNGDLPESDYKGFVALVGWLGKPLPPAAAPSAVAAPQPPSTPSVATVKAPAVDNPY